MLSSWLKLNPQVEWVECVAVDFSGVLRGKRVAVKYVDTGTLPRLPLDIFMQTIDGHFASVYDDGRARVNATDGDCLLSPDVTTATLAPWTDGRDAVVLCDAQTLDQQPLAYTPRALLKRVLALYSARGWRPVIGPELEFFLLHPYSEGDGALRVYADPDDHSLIAGQPYSVELLHCMDHYFSLVNDFCQQQSIPVDTVVKEGSGGQYELSLLHGDPLRKADELVMLKRILRVAAKRFGMLATFMAKPIAGKAGSALHLHQSVVDAKSGDNLFSDQAGADSALFLGTLGGLQTYLPDSMAFLLPYPNSYRRIEPRMAAPLNYHWSRDNRTVGLRVPVSVKQGTYDRSRRVENRLAGADSNPYLAIAVSLAAAYQGMVEQLEPSAHFDENAYDEPVALPKTLDHALYKLRKSSVFQQLFGDEAMRIYCGIKARELADYNQVVPPRDLSCLAGVI